MAAKKSKSRVSKSANKKSGFKFQWWMAVILVGVVAVIGIVIVRFSRATLSCGSAQQGAICDNGPVSLKVLSTTNSTCGPTLTYRCGFYNNGQFYSSFYTGFDPANKTGIYRMDNSFNTTCGRISTRNPVASKGSDPGYLSAYDLWNARGSDNWVWWTSVGC